jgi:Protein of unknown function (DUF3376)
MTVTDDIAERLAVWWCVDRRSDRLYALRAMVRVWRENKYYENRNKKKEGQAESVNAFLDDYDVKYRLRRTGFLLRKVHQLIRLARKLSVPQHECQPASEIEERLQERLLRYGLSISSENSGAVFDALSCLARGFSEAMSELRAATWIQAPSHNAPMRAAECGTLDRVLRLLLGEELNPPLRELATRDGEPVPVASPKLPLPNPLRSLQDNVFARASALFSLAKQTSPTFIQELLENDVEDLRAIYAKVIRPSEEHKGPVVRALLGDPELVPSSGPVTSEAKPSLIIVVKDVDPPHHVALNTAEGKALRRFLAEYYLRFDEYDQMSFPLYYDTGTGEPATVEVLRISPEDAPSLIDELNDQGEAGCQRRKLAGTALFHFGAFLDARWRRNDIMWGRLDGCERLLAAMFPATKDNEIRQALLAEAQRTIVREEMQPAGYDQLIDRFAQALAAQKQANLNKAFEDLWTHLDPAEDEQRRIRMGQVLKAVLSEAGMVEYVRRYYEINRDLDTKETLLTGARALTITGRILEESEKRYRVSYSRMVWLTRAGRGLQALLAISTPGSLERAIFHHWLALLYVFELMIVVAAFLLSASAALTFGLTAFGVTATVNVASLIAGDLIGRKRGWIIAAGTVLLMTLLVLAALGSIALYGVGLHGILCAGGKHEILRSTCELLHTSSGEFLYDTSGLRAFAVPCCG